MNTAGADQPPAIGWADFAAQHPDLAQFGVGRLTAAPAYLGTIRPSGGPRVHPVTPIIGAGGLFVFMEPTSPKGNDLRTRATFALHNGVADNQGSGGEFWITGRAVTVGDPHTWSLVARAAGYTPADRYVLFELRLSQARCHGYGDVALPSPRSWSAGNDHAGDS